MKANDLYKETTNRIIRELEEGTPPWVKPWKHSHVRGIGMLPSNLVTGRLYSGSNILLLWMTASLRGYSSLQFCTYKQANDMGARVRKGEKSCNVLFTKRTTKEDEETGDQKATTIVKVYSVFHVSQLDEVPDRYLHEQAPLDLEPTPQKFRDFISSSGMDVRFGFNEACYIPSQDFIKMPAFGVFDSEEAFASTLLHESCHWAGHESRLNRKLSTKFASKEYSFEELIAELGSAFLCARLGYQPQTQTASYLQSWLKVLKEDSRAIFTAASYAGQAADWIWKQAYGEEEQQDYKEAAE